MTGQRFHTDVQPWNEWESIQRRMEFVSVRPPPNADVGPAPGDSPESDEPTLGCEFACDVGLLFAQVVE